MKLQVTILTVLLLSLVLGAGKTAVNPTAIPINATTKVAASATDAITIPRMLSYQGKLTDTAGRPVRDTLHWIMFRLYDVASGGTPFWSATYPVQTRSGLFNVLLGTNTPIESVPNSGNLYLSMQVGVDPEMTTRVRIVSAAYAFEARHADTADFAYGVPSSTNAWVRGTPDSILYTAHNLGIARGEAGNMLHGANRFTHVNLGVACTTGKSGLDYSYVTISGGFQNTASGSYATVGGGRLNAAKGGNDAVGGGRFNTADGGHSTVGGGEANAASRSYATVAGGLHDTSAAFYSFTTGNHSVVPTAYSNSAAFNGQAATASSQTRVGALSKASGTFTIDHPLDPAGKILNHYFIEGPEMRNIYDGEAVLDASGRAVVTLPDYFDALNRKPRVQLTGVGRSDVYVAEKVSGNRFTIGGSPGTEVYWQVTGERKDVSAEATRRMMPVEQPKTGDLQGRMLDDDFLVGCMEQLVREGKAAGIDFRTAAGRQRYENMKRMSEEKR
jgi:hypothetical protein